MAERPFPGPLTCLHHLTCLYHLPISRGEPHLTFWVFLASEEGVLAIFSFGGAGIFLGKYLFIYLFLQRGEKRERKIHVRSINQLLFICVWIRD